VTRRFWLLWVMCTVLSGSVRAEWVALKSAQPAGPRLTAVNTGNGTTRVEVSLPGFHLETVEIDGVLHSRLHLPGEVPTLDAGAPELPFVTARLRLPDQGTPRVKILDAVWREIAVAPVLPSKGNLSRLVDPAEVPWRFGPAYAAGGVFPPKVTALGTPYIVRDARGVPLRIHPLRWDRERGVLLALERLTLEVTTDGTGGVNETTPRTRPVDRAFADLYAQTFDNADPAAKYNLISDEGRMLVICHDSLVEAIAEFVAWKQACGIPVDVVTTGSVGGTLAGIQGAIRTRYFSADGLTYVVLVGDIDQVPTYTGDFEGADDDTRYGRLEGDDVYPDLFVSRISAETAAQVRVQTNKFIRYERDPDADGDWYERALGAAGSEVGDSDLTDFQRADLLRDELLDYHYTEADRIYMPAGTTAALSTAINDGRSLIYYIGHGSGAAWNAPYFGLPQVAALQNGWANPWILDVSCSNGDFSQSECFAELWMRVGTPSEPQGAVAIYSASTATPWVPPCLMQTEAVDLLVTDRARTIGSLLQHGIMRVLDAYPGDEGLQLVEQYNIFGDCSLRVRSRKPRPLQVTHPPELAVGQDHFFVQTNLPGLTVALTGDGLLRGRAVTDALGRAEIQLAYPADILSSVDLTVTGVDVLTHRSVVPVGQAPWVVLSADTLAVGETTDLTIWVNRPGALSTAGLEVEVKGHGVLESVAALTDAVGVAQVSVLPLCGETLTVHVREPGNPADLARRTLPVTGAEDLTGASIAVTVPSAELAGQLVPGLPALITGRADQDLLTMKLLSEAGEVFAGWGADSLAVEIIPQEPGSLTVALIKVGYNVVTADFPVAPVFLPLAGVVSAAADGSLLSEAVVRLYQPGTVGLSEPVAEALSGADGTFALHSPVPVVPYDLKVTRFGYATRVETYVPSATALDRALGPAQIGALAGTLRSGATGDPLDGLVELLRADTGQKVAQVFSDPVTGAFRLDGLPYFEYRLLATADSFLPWETVVDLADTLALVDPAPRPATGSILVIQDDLLPSGDLSFPAKLTKTGAILAPAHIKPRSAAALDMLVDLMGRGYSATYLPASASDPSTWADYDLLIYSCGNSYDNLAPALRTALLAHVDAGGRLLLEGGDVAYVHRRDPDLAGRVMQLDRWTGDAAEYLSLAGDNNVLQGAPHLIEGQIVVANSSYGDVDQLVTTQGTSVAGEWGMGEWDAITCVDGDPDPVGGQIVFFAFDYGAVDFTRRADLLQNAVNYLLLTPVATAAVSGVVSVGGAADHSGVTVQLEPGPHTGVTGPDGAFSLSGLASGTYRLTATAPGYSAAVRTVTVAAGEQVEYLALAVGPTLIDEVCDVPALAIPDVDPAGVSTSLEVALGSRVSGVSVQVDLTHPWAEDLTLELTSPAGTTARLHHHQTGGAAGLTGWFPATLPVWDDLAVFLGEETDGTWTLRLTDDTLGDTGLLVAWCLRLEYEAIPSDAADPALPRTVALLGNHPNPFNPSTTIRFALPHAGPVDLAVYDLSGRRIRTLVAGDRPAGRQAVIWDGRDQAGRAVASGTYFHRLSAGGDVHVGKMLLVK